MLINYPRDRVKEKDGFRDIFSRTQGEIISRESDEWVEAY